MQPPSVQAPLIVPPVGFRSVISRSTRSKSTLALVETSTPEVIRCRDPIVSITRLAYSGLEVQLYEETPSGDVLHSSAGRTDVRKTPSREATTSGRRICHSPRYRSFAM